MEQGYPARHPFAVGTGVAPLPWGAPQLWGRGSAMGYSFRPSCLPAHTREVQVGTTVKNRVFYTMDLYTSEKILVH